LKTSFCGYYSANPEEVSALWREGLIVLDTNVLLDLYRVPSSTREQVLLLLDSLAQRLWLPHHVALEYQRNRLQVMHVSHKKSQVALEKIGGSFNALMKQVSELQLEKRGVGERVDQLLSTMSDAFKSLLESASVVPAEQLDPAVADPVRARLDELFAGRVGPPPPSQAALNEIFKEGSKRFAAQMGPGYKDDEKGKDQPTYMSGGLIYERKFGDYVVWTQLLEYAQTAGVTRVIFVTSDVKPDWWEFLEKERVGPLPELRSEIARVGVADFAMYTLADFMVGAGVHLGVAVTDNAKRDVEEIERGSQSDLLEEHELSRNVAPVFTVPYSALQAIESILGGGLGNAKTIFGEASFIDLDAASGLRRRLLVVPSKAMFAPYKSGLRMFLEETQEVFEGQYEVGLIVYGGKRNFDGEEEFSDFVLEIASCANLSFDHSFPLYVAARVSGAVAAREVTLRGTRPRRQVGN
jgi:hypothetical protein